MTAIRKIVSDWPLAAFALLTYALSWWTVPFADGGMLPHGPFLAAMLVISIASNRTRFVAYWRSLLRLPAHPKWWLIAPSLVLAYLAAAFVIVWWLRSPQLNPLNLAALPSTVLELMLLGGWWEEPGWSGYALPLLLDRYGGDRRGMLRASGHLAAVRALWHLPLVLSGAIAWYDAVFLSLAAQFLITWVYLGSGRSVLAVMVLHLTSNIVGGGIAMRLLSDADRALFYPVFIACACMLALLLHAIAPRSLGEPANELNRRASG